MASDLLSADFVYLFLFQIITVPNQTMHSPDLSVEDQYKMESLNKMVSFLETVQHAVKGKYDDITDCGLAIENIKKVSYC